MVTYHFALKANLNVDGPGKCKVCIIGYLMQALACKPMRMTYGIAASL